MPLADVAKNVFFQEAPPGPVAGFLSRQALFSSALSRGHDTFFSFGFGRRSADGVSEQVQIWVRAFPRVASRDFVEPVRLFRDKR